MIWLLAIAAYIAIGLLTARWFYRVNSEDGNIDTTSINDIQFSAAITLLFGALWPLVWGWLGAVRFIVNPKGAKR